MSHLVPTPLGEPGDAALAALEGCLRDLPAPARRLLALRYADGLTVGQIAAALRASDAAIHGRLKRVFASLSTCLERKGVEL